MNENHGDDRHITLQGLQGAAEAADISLDEVSQNLREAARLNSQDDDARSQTETARSGADGSAD
ncbi:MAG: hypothetical protein ACREMY_16300 [bacterium]